VGHGKAGGAGGSGAAGKPTDQQKGGDGSALPRNAGGPAGGGAAALGSDDKKTVQIDAGALVDATGGNNGQGALGVIIVLGNLSADDPTHSLIGNLGLFPDGITQPDFFAFGGGGGAGGGADGLPTPEPSTFGLLVCGVVVAITGARRRLTSGLL
jgi:hypothetical protein